MAADDISFKLDRAELKFAQSIINSRVPGEYTLRQLFGKDHWDGDKLGEVRNYGGRFRQSVLKRELERISEFGKKSNSIVYSVHPRG